MAQQPETVQLSPHELFEQKLLQKDLQIGAASDRLFGNQDQSGALLIAGNTLARSDVQIKKLEDRIVVDGEIDHEAVTREGIELAKKIDGKGLVEVILINSAILRAKVLETGGVFHENGEDEGLRFARRIQGNVEISYERAILEIVERYKVFDLNSIIQEAIEHRIENPDFWNARLYTAVLLSGLKTETALSNQDIADFTSVLLTQGTIDTPIADALSERVLTGQEVEYTAQLIDTKSLNERRSSEKRMQGFFTKSEIGFKAVNDVYVEIENASHEKEVVKIVAVCDGKTEGEMFGVDDNELIWKREKGEWLPVIIDRKISKDVTDKSQANAQDVDDHAVIFSNAGNGKKELKVGTGKGSVIKKEERVDVENQAIFQRKSEREVVETKMKEVETWDNTPIERCDSQIEIISENGEARPVDMVAMTINAATPELRKLVDFDVNGPQGYFDKDGNFYMRLAKIDDKDGNGEGSFHFIDLANKTDEVYSRSYQHAKYYETGLNISDLVDDARQVGIKHGRSWAIVEKIYKDNDTEKELTWYQVVAPIFEGSSEYGKTTKRILDAQNFEYAGRGKPTTLTPEVIGVRMSVKTQDKKKSGLLGLLSRLGTESEKKQIYNIIDTDLPRSTDERRIKTRIKGLTRDLLINEYGTIIFSDNLTPIKVKAEGNRAFLDANGKQVREAEVPIFMTQSTLNGVLNLDLNGNIYVLPAGSSQGAIPVWRETINIANIKDVLLRSV